jgi:hypothetical protein
VRFGCATHRRTGGRVVVVHVYAVLLAATQGGCALVAAGEGGEYLHLQTQCRADKRLSQRLIPRVIGSGGPDGPEP